MQPPYLSATGWSNKLNKVIPKKKNKFLTLYSVGKYFVLKLAGRFYYNVAGVISSSGDL